MSSDSNIDTRKGDWVKVWAQVVQPNVLSGETAVTIQSHNTDYVAHVRNAHLTVVGFDDRPPGVQTCTGLTQTTLIGSAGISVLALVRCARHERHSGPHDDDQGTTWHESETCGYVEEKA